MFFAAAVVGDRIGTWAAARIRFAASQTSVDQMSDLAGGKQILSPSSSSSSSIATGSALADALGRHLSADLVGLVTIYARTRDCDLIVAVETDRDGGTIAWLCGPYGPDALAGWRLPIVPDRASRHATPPCAVKAVDLNGMPGVTLVVRGRISGANGRHQRHHRTFLVRLPPASSSRDKVVHNNGRRNKGANGDDSDAERVDQRQPTVTEFSPTTAPWRAVWHDERQLIAGLHTRWSPAAAAWMPPTDDDVWRVRHRYYGGGDTEFGWDATVRYDGYWLRWRLDRIEWVDPLAPMSPDDADDHCLAPAHSQAYRHGVTVDVAANTLYLLARCCECHGTADHPESLVVWSAPLTVTWVDANRNADGATQVRESKSQAAVATGLPSPYGRRHLSIGLWRPHIVSGLWTGILQLPSPPAVVYSHTHDAAYHLRGTLPDGRLWFAAGSGSFVVQTTTTTTTTRGDGQRSGPTDDERICCGWRHSGDGESLHHLLGFADQPDRRRTWNILA